MRLEQLLDFIIGQLARSSSRTRVGHLTRPIPSRRLGNPSPMSNKSIAFTKKRREGVDEGGGWSGWKRAIKLALHAARSKQVSRAGESLVMQQTYFGDVQK